MHWHWLPGEIVKPSGDVSSYLICQLLQAAKYCKLQGFFYRLCYYFSPKLAIHCQNEKPFCDANGGDDDDHDDDGEDADDHENHLIAFVGGNMPARFDWADIRVLSTSVLLTNTC